MNPQEILQNTINSVCTEDVIDNFKKLKDLRNTQLNGTKSLERDMNKLKESMTRVDEYVFAIFHSNKFVILSTQIHPTLSIKNF